MTKGAIDMNERGVTERRGAMRKRLVAMRTVVGFALVGATGMMPRGASAQVPEPEFEVASDRSAGLVVFPKIVVDTAGLFHDSRAVDTLIQLTNTGAVPIEAHCFYIDASRFCGGTTTPCQANSDCTPGLLCGAPVWTPTNFDVPLTPNEPFGWSAAAGFGHEGLCQGGARAGQPCDPDSPGGATCGAGVCKVVLSGGANEATVPPSFAGAGSVTPVGPYFIGELKCIEVASSTTLQPLLSNDIKGDATIEEVTSGSTGTADARAYNGIGIPSTGSGATVGTSTPGGTEVLCLGANAATTDCTTQTYQACPSRLILDHWFDDATNEEGQDVTTDLTLVPCTENIEVPPGPATTVVQFIVYNEFEQRTSASTSVTCFSETQLSDFDSPRSHSNSVFNVAVQGTLTGQTFVQPLAGGTGDIETGFALLGVAEEFYTANSGAPTSTAFNLNYVPGATGQVDFVRYLSP